MNEWYAARAIEFNRWWQENMGGKFGAELYDAGDEYGVPFRLTVYGEPEDEELCMTALCKALEILAAGNKTLIRIAPVVQRNKDFATDKEYVSGAVRFHIFNEEGPWVWPEPGDGKVRWVSLPQMAQP